ncbi:Uncharacterized protein HZ326_19475 [Fusarium oxysporum f. sp. albedinis]|nr:Uncharacterized protein HZ326_19475 [Fusarium oxysporum f. sp. albedinis]
MTPSAVTETANSAETNGKSTTVLSLSPEVAPKLAPEYVKYFNEVLCRKTPTHAVAIEEVRQDPHKWAQPWINNLDEISKRTVDYKVKTTDGSSITVRAYQPDQETFGPGPYAVHVNYHGGGFIFGDLSSDAAFCSTVRQRLPIVVVDVDYRLCPGSLVATRCISQWMDANQVYDHPHELNVKNTSISIGGISAGGHFCCVLQHLSRDTGIPLRLCIPAVPPTADHSPFQDPSECIWPSFTEYQNAPMLNWERISHFQKYTFPKDMLADIRASVPRFWVTPLEANSFAGLCDTFIITAECDPLRDEGEAYGKLLVEAGVKATFKRYRGVPHPFMHMTAHLPQARQYDDDVCKALEAAHHLEKNLRKKEQI